MSLPLFGGGGDNKAGLSVFLDLSEKLADRCFCSILR